MFPQCYCSSSTSLDTHQAIFVFYKVDRTIPQNSPKFFFCKNDNLAKIHQPAKAVNQCDAPILIAWKNKKITLIKLPFATWVCNFSKGYLQEARSKTTIQNVEWSYAARRNESYPGGLGFFNRDRDQGGVLSGRHHRVRRASDTSPERPYKILLHEYLLTS